MPTLYLKDRLKTVQGQRLTLTLFDKSPGLLTKKSKAGGYYEVFEYKWRTPSGEEFTESVWPKTTTGKENPLLKILTAVMPGMSVIAYLNEGGYVEYESASATTPIVGKQQAVQNTAPTPTPAYTSSIALDELIYDLKLGIAGIVQALLVRGTQEHIIRGELENENPKQFTAAEWTLWIRNKANELARKQLNLP